MSSIKGLYHPNAYLQRVKNVTSGLKARTKILCLLDQQPFSAPALARSIAMSYDTVLYHLHLLEAEAMVRRREFVSYLDFNRLRQRRLVDQAAALARGLLASWAPIRIFVKSCLFKVDFNYICKEANQAITSANSFSMASLSVPLIASPALGLHQIAS